MRPRWRQSEKGLPFRHRITALLARCHRSPISWVRIRDAGVQLLVSSAYRNDPETHELLAADVMPHFA